jgi:endogenous inhibitor of DNA gyrase (YacG/DUF329 family)
VRAELHPVCGQLGWIVWLPTHPPLSAAMPFQTRCPTCGGPAVIKYIQIPIAEVQADGTRILPSQWPKVVECPKCGTKEQKPANTRGLRK